MDVQIGYTVDVQSGYASDMLFKQVVCERGCSMDSKKSLNNLYVDVRTCVCDMLLG